jgi:hypothetical protein
VDEFTTSLRKYTATTTDGAGDQGGAPSHVSPDTNSSTSPSGGSGGSKITDGPTTPPEACDGGPEKKLQMAKKTDGSGQPAVDDKEKIRQRYYQALAAGMSPAAASAYANDPSSVAGDLQGKLSAVRLTPRRPPKEFQFKPGRSGNPKGRPRRSEPRPQQRDAGNFWSSW